MPRRTRTRRPPGAACARPHAATPYAGPYAAVSAAAPLRRAGPALAAVAALALLAGTAAGARVAAAARGHGSALASAEPAGSALTLLLPVRSRISGRVVDEHDRPVPDAEVAARSPERSWQGPWTARTGRDGRFALEVEAAGGSYLLRAERAGWAPAETTTAAPAPGTSTTGVRLVLRRGRTARGRVVDEAESPVAGARVTLEPSPEGRDVWRLRIASTGDERSEAATDAEGRFAVADLGGGRYDLAVEAAGFAPVEVPGIEVPDGAGETDLGTVVLAPGQRLIGRVVDPDGHPVEGAHVSLDRSERPYAFGTSRIGGEPAAVTAPDGRFEIADLAAGRRLDLTVRRSGYAAATVSGVTPPVDEPLRIVLHPTVAIRGRVVGPDGEPVEGAELRARPANPFAGAAGRLGAGPARSDEDGEFALTGVEPGEVVLSATAPGYQRREIAGIAIDPGRDRDGVRVELAPGGTVRGTVSDADGEPVADAWVRVETEVRPLRSDPLLDARTDAEGRYELDGVPPGRRTISARHDDHVGAVRDLEVVAGEQRLDLRLERGFEIRGRVLDPAGAPIEAAHVSLATRLRIGGWPVVTTGGDGGFTLEAVEPGTYRARAEKQGWAPGVSEPIAVDGPVDGVELRLERGATIVGTVVGADPEDLASLTILAHRRGGWGHPSAMAPVDFEGRFRLPGVLPGDWTVIATGGMGMPVASVTVDVEPGAVEAPVTIELGGGLALAGEVLARGRPLAGVMVAVGTEDGTSGGFDVTDHRGAFRIDGLEPGDHRLQVLRPGSGLRHQEAIRLDGDREVTVELDLASIRGRVVDAADGMPIGGATLDILSPDSEPTDAFAPLLGLDARSAPDGSFHLPDVSGGSRVVAVAADGYQSARVPVEIAPGADLSGLEIELRRATAEAELEVRTADGVVPDAVDVLVLPGTAEGAGSALPAASGRYPVGTGGRVRVRGLRPGPWRIRVAAPGYTAVAASVVLPGPATVVTLHPAGYLSVQVPELAEAGRLGEVRLRDAAGRPFVFPDHDVRPQESFPLTEGGTTVPNVPPGAWTVEVTTPDGRTWTGRAVVVPRDVVEVVLE